MANHIVQIDLEPYPGMLSKVLSTMSTISVVETCVGHARKVTGECSIRMKSFEPDREAPVARLNISFHETRIVN